MSQLPPRLPSESKAMAITTLVLGVCGIVPVLGLIPALAAIILGLVVLIRRKAGTGLAIGGLACGAVTLLFNLAISMALILPAINAARHRAQAVQQQLASRQAELPLAKKMNRPPAVIAPPAAVRPVATNQPVARLESDRVAVSPQAAASMRTAAVARAIASMSVLPAGEAAGLIADLQSGDQRRQVPASMKLLHVRPAAPDPAMAQALVQVVRDSRNLPIRVNAAHALEAWATPESLPALQEMAGDPSPLIQKHARQAIARLSP